MQLIFQTNDQTNISKPQILDQLQAPHTPSK